MYMGKGTNLNTRTCPDVCLYIIAVDTVNLPFLAYDTLIVQLQDTCKLCYSSGLNSIQHAICKSFW